MSYKPEQPIRINKSFQVDSMKEVTTGAVPYIIVKGYASKMLDAFGDAVIDADREHINTDGINLKRMATGNIPLLFGHDQNSAIGTVTTAEYKADGLEITAKLYQLPGDDLSNYVYQATKAGILNSFSVGILVSAFDMVEKSGEDFLQLAESELIEVSLVAVPSNSESTFGILEVKSLDNKDTAYKTLISKAGLKAENPQICEEFGTCVLNTTKALDYQGTKNEPWMTHRQFDVYLNSLTETLVDNFSAGMWDELTATVLIENMEKAFAAFIQDQQDLLNGEEPSDANELNAALAHDGSFAFSDNAKSINGEDMRTKDVEDPAEKVEEKVETVVVEEKVETVVVEEKPKEEAPVVKEDSTKTEVKEDEPEVVLEATKEDAVDRTADDFVVETALLGANIDKMELEDMAKYFDSMSTLSEIISDFVTSNVKEEAEAQRA